MSATDLVVVLPGITGSTLWKDNIPVWEPSAGAVVNAIRSVGRSLQSIALPQGIGDEDPHDGVHAAAVMPDVHVLPGIWTPIQGYTRLLKRLEKMQDKKHIGKVLPFPYDWRLSNRLTATRLAEFVERNLQQWRDSDAANGDAQVVLICHSMGGLVGRWYIEHCGGKDVTRALITLGTPNRGAAKSIDQLANGVRKGFGPLGLDLTAFARSMPSSYQLLPEYECLDQPDKMYKVDEIPIPDLDTSMVRDAMHFHRDLIKSEGADRSVFDRTMTIVGEFQPTMTTARVSGGSVEMLETYRSDNHFGDATVPTPGAVPNGMNAAAPEIHRVVDTHGHLQANPAVLDLIEAFLRAEDIRFRGPERDSAGVSRASVRVPELVWAGEPLQVSLHIEPGADGRIPAVEVAVIAEGGAVVAPPSLPAINDEGDAAVSFAVNQPGAYTVRVSGAFPGAEIAPLEATVLVWG